jgi:hypothetical protein
MRADMKQRQFNGISGSSAFIGGSIFVNGRGRNAGGKSIMKPQKALVVNR